MNKKFISGLLAYSVVGVIAIAIGFVAFLGFMFKEITPYSPLYIIGAIILIGLFVGNDGAVFKILANFFRNLKNKLIKKE